MRNPQEAHGLTFGKKLQLNKCQPTWRIIKQPINIIPHTYILYRTLDYQLFDLTHSVAIPVITIQLTMYTNMVVYKFTLGQDGISTVFEWTPRNHAAGNRAPTALVNKPIMGRFCRGHPRAGTESKHISRTDISANYITVSLSFSCQSDTIIYNFN